MIKYSVYKTEILTPHMICKHNFTRSERRALYSQILQSSKYQNIKIGEYAKFRKEDASLTHQIHVDAKRGMWHVLKNDQLIPHLLKENPLAVPLVNENAFIRFHQRYLELFCFDVMQNRPKNSYFQGLNQVLAPLFFVFTKEEFLQDNTQLKDFLLNTEQNALDFETVDGGVEQIVYDYQNLVKLSLRMCDLSMGPLFEQDLKKLQSYVQLTFDPLLRFIDCKLYCYIKTSPELMEIAPSLLMGTILSQLQYNVNTLESSLSLLDATVQSDVILTLFLAAAFLSISVRACNQDVPVLQANLFKFLPDAQKTIGEREFKDVMTRVMSSLDKGDKVVEDFASHVIELGMCAFAMSVMSQGVANDDVLAYTAKNFHVKQIAKKLEQYENIQQKLLSQYIKAVGMDYKDWICNISGETGKLFQFLEQSVKYAMDNNVKGTQLDFSKVGKQILDVSVQMGKKTAELAKNGLALTEKGLNIAATGINAGLKYTGGKLEQFYNFVKKKVAEEPQPNNHVEQVPQVMQVKPLPLPEQLQGGSFFDENDEMKK